MARSSTHAGRNEKPSVSSVAYDGSLEEDLAFFQIRTVDAETQKDMVLRALFEVCQATHKPGAPLAIAKHLDGQFDLKKVASALCTLSSEGKVRRLGYGKYVPANAAALKAKYGRGGE